MKGNWKKYLTSGLILSASAVLLAACAGGDSKDTPKDSSVGSDATEEVKVEGKVKVWIDTEHTETFKGIVADFEKEFPDVDVEIAAGSSADAKKDDIGISEYIKYLIRKDMEENKKNKGGK